MAAVRRRLGEIQTAACALCAAAICTGAHATPPALPVPCTPGSCGTNGPSQWVTGGAATATSLAAQNALKISQTTGTAILNWSSFNIAAGNSVTFQQPSSSAIALNRIFQASPSQIFGQLNANGQIYLVNLNGFVFGPNSSVNVGSLLASSLPLALTDATFGKGILSPLQTNNGAVLDATQDPQAPGVGRTSVLDLQGNPVLDSQGNPVPVQIVVQPGAQLTAASQGRLMLAGQSVTNGGSLTAPDGQIVLAAGAKAYLQASTDPALRGLVVEVDQGPAEPADGNHGTAWNQLTGTLSAPRGNVTMVGLAVNQEGRISATTSVSANGSIRLEAAYTPTFPTAGGVAGVASTQGGKLTIGSQSDMEILPELASSATEVPAQQQLQSSVSLLGEQIFVKGGSIVAPGGTLTAIAAANPSAAATQLAANSGSGITAEDPNARLRIDPGTSIDLSGSQASLPVTANLVAAQLRSAELADDPTQRNGPLHGQTVYIDARNPPPASLANLQGEIQAIAQNVAQRTETGGNALFQSAGDLVFASGATVNVSGGSTTYAGGVLQTSYLIGANGKLYPIATANPLLSYVGVLNPTFSQTFNKWGVQDVLPTPGLSTYQPGYVQGAAAGRVQFAAPAMVLQGTLQGSAVNGLYQRTPASAVQGGQLIIGLPGGFPAGPNLLQTDYLSPAVQFSRASFPIVTSDDSPLPQPLTLDLPTSYLTGTGFTSTQIYSNYDVTLPAGPALTLPAGSALTVEGAHINILAGITDAGGSLSFQNVYSIGTLASGAARPGVVIGDGVTFDVSGLWTNDMPIAGGNTLAQTWQNGGAIRLGVGSPGALLSIGDDVTLKANGGGWVNTKGKLTAGSGGTVALTSDGLDSGLDIGRQMSISGFGVEGAAGGTFTLSAPRVEVSSGNGGWAPAQQVDDTLSPGGFFHVYANLFSDYGFQKFSLNASGLVAPGAANSDLLAVDANTPVSAIVSTLFLDPGSSLAPSANSIAGLATITTLAPYQRKPAYVSLSALPPLSVSPPSQQAGQSFAGDVVIDTGASVSTDAGGAINLTSLDSLVVNGVLKAPGGSVALHVVSPTSTAYTSFDVGFLPNQRIDLGPSGTIDVSGTFVPTPSTLGLDLGTLYAGGTVNMLADRGTVVAEQGSLISIAGASAPQDVLQVNGTYGHELAASSGGSFTTHSGDSIFLLGALQAAGGGQGTSGTAASGSLEVDLTRSESWWQITQNLNTYNPAPMDVELLPQLPVTVGLPTLLFNSNTALLGAADLTLSGIDALRIEAGGAINTQGSVSLGLGRSIVLNAPIIAGNSGAQASFSAPYVEVGYSVGSGNGVIANTNTASPGTGSVHFSGGEIDLVGTTVFQGISAVALSSSGDLVLRGAGASLQGGTSVAGTLTLDAARIYPASATSFTLAATSPAPGTAGSAGKIVIGQTSADPGAPYSAGGSLTVSADDIESTGTVYVPFGSIALNATTSLTLGDHSVTSVSGAGLTIPYGQTELGAQQWVYLDNGSGLTGIPTRTVTLSAPSVTLSKSSTVDLTGGGDLLAYEWVPGTGGTVDALSANDSSAAGLYAILPGTRGGAAPQDPLYSSTTTIAPGETVYLSGGAGLAAGTYPLLPARYAVVPGAYLIQVEPNMVSTTPGSLGTLADGTPVAAGYYSYGSTGLHQTPGYTGFAIYPGSHGAQLAQYDLNLASSYFSAAATAAGKPRPALPADAGSLAIVVGSTLNAAGQIRTAAATGGLAAPIEISANDLVVGTPSGPVPADAVTIDGTVLAGWHPGSLLLGGAFAASDPNTINVLANSVTVGAGTALTADQIVLAANQSVDVQPGAMLRSTSAATGAAPTALPSVQSVTLNGSGGGAALLAVSDLNWLTPTGAATGGTATVSVEAGASIGSRGSISISGPGHVTLSDGAASGPGAEWSLGSSSIAFVPTGTQQDALSVDSQLLNQLGSAAAVRLASGGAIDFYTPVSFGVSGGGAPTLSSLTLSATSLNNQAGVGTTQLGAQTLVLQGLNATPVAGTAGAPGASLVLTANELDIGANALAVNGFASTQASVGGPVVGRNSGALNVGGDLTVTASGLTAAASADAKISASGALNIAASHGGRLPILTGGELELAGGTVDIAGVVSAPSGIVKVSSTSGLINIDTGAVISVAGQRVDIQNQSVGTPGGVIAIQSGGDLTLAAGAILDVSGASGGGGYSGAGGTLSLSAVGAATVDATPHGAGGTGAGGGGFALDAGSLPASAGTNPLTALATAIGSGGFSNSIDLRLRNGNVSLDSGSTLAANEVSLTADTGTVTIGGQIDASSGALRGSISIFGGSGVELASGGGLHANGAGPGGFGGTIELGAGQLLATPNATGGTYAYNNAAILLAAGSVISATGGAGNGTLLLRAPALISTNDVAIQSLQADTSGVGRIVVEPVLPFATTDTRYFSSVTAPTAADFSNVQNAVSSYMSAAGSAIAARLTPGSGSPLLVEPGVELVAPGALTLPGLDLSTPGWRFNNGVAPIDLTVRAGGDVTVANTLSDGFGGTQAQPTLLPGLSSSMRLVSGADLTSANPLAVTQGAGTLTIGAGAVVRTGTGDIDLVAGQNVVIGGSGSGAYTAGIPAIAPGGTAANPYPVPSGVGTVDAGADGLLITGSDQLMSFPAGGGNLLVRAGGDLIGAALSQPSVSSWQLRSGGGQYTPPGASGPQPFLPQWGVNLAAYNWNFGTLGGGDLSISAGHDALNVTAAAAGSLLPQYGGGTQYIRSGGLSFTAGHDIGSAEVFLEDGIGSVAANGALTALLPSGTGGPNIGSAFFLQSSSLNVIGRLGIVADGVFNPTGLSQLASPTAKSLIGSYFTYSDDSSLSLQSVAGDISLGQASDANPTLLGTRLNNDTTAHGVDNGVLPATLSVQALGGSIDFGSGFGGNGIVTLYPSARGQLELLAAADITGSAGSSVTMSDAAPGSYATVASPLGKTSVIGAPFAGNIHAADPNPATVTAGDSVQNLRLSVPKAAQIVAGSDITDVTYSGENLNADDLTALVAGHDFAYSQAYGGGNGVSVGGPGAVDILAGRNVSLGFSQGVATTGNLLNPNLPTAQGADLTVATGLGTQPDFSGFVTAVIALSPTYQSKLVNYVEGLQGATGLSYPAAAAAFGNLTPQQQRPLIDAVFFNELLKSGRAYNTRPGAGFSEGYAAIDALFPGSRSGSAGAIAGSYAGDLTLAFSRIYTLSGGNIDLLVPGGLVNVGLANPPASLSSRAPSTLGIVAEGAGDVNIYTRGDVDVNASRVFTLGGGNILVWSDEGSIDAGRGAKAAVSAPPPAVLINSDGTVTIDYSGAAAGSGIRTIQTNPDQALGSVDLIAPLGTVNAGDAGIGAAGNINIAARSVVGLSNISFGGTATGVPSQVSDLGATLSGASAAGSSTSTSATASAEAAQRADQNANAPLTQTALSWLDVFVTGLGEENCKPDDLDCLKRQKSN